MYALGARASEMPLSPPDSKLAGTSAVGLTAPPYRRERRKMFRRLLCAVPGYYPICCDTNDPETQVAGLKKRLLRDVPEADPSWLTEFAAFVDQWLADNVPRASSLLSFEEWLETTSYTIERKNELRSVWLGLRGYPPTLKECRRIKSFGKTESYPAYKFMRWINSRVDKVKVWFGPLMKTVEHIIFIRPEFIKHVPVPERPSILRTLVGPFRRYLLTDYTAYESHFTEQIMLACEVRLYRHVLGHLVTSDELDRMVAVLTGDNHLATSLGVKCTVKARRMSGEMCTSLGNGFSNLMTTLFIAKKIGSKVEGFVEGDDGIFAFTGNLPTEQDYRKLGFTIKAQEVNHPCEMIPVDAQSSPFGVNTGAFCGILCSEGGQIIRDPRAFLSTFGWTSSFIHAGDVIMNQLQRAKALSALYETPACPIIRAAAIYALRATEGYAPRFVHDGYHHPVPCDVTRLKLELPTPETRELFAVHFGVSPQAQEQIEARLDRGDFNVVDILGTNADMLHYGSRFVEADS